MSNLKFLMVLVVSLLIINCTGALVNVNRCGQKVDLPLTIGIGDVFFFQEVMTGEDNYFGSVFKGDAYKIELLVSSATKEKITLDYSEYMKPVAGQYGGYRKDGPWIKKPAFDKTLEFDLKETNTIYYKGFEFEIVNISGGKISYKRIK